MDYPHFFNYIDLLVTSVLVIVSVCLTIAAIRALLKRSTDSADGTGKNRTESFIWVGNADFGLIIIMFFSAHFPILREPSAASGIRW